MRTLIYKIEKVSSKWVVTITLDGRQAKITSKTKKEGLAQYREWRDRWVMENLEDAIEMKIALIRKDDCSCSEELLKKHYMAHPEYV